jgi:hypothetical protein
MTDIREDGQTVLPAGDAHAEAVLAGARAVRPPAGAPKPAATRAAACALITVALACAAGRSGGHHASGNTVRPSAPVTLPPALSCEAAVLALLSESATDAQDGYGGGLDPEQVLARYGEESPVYQAWSQLDGQVLAAQEEHGPDGLLTPFVPQVARLCKQYGG